MNRTHASATRVLVVLGVGLTSCASVRDQPPVDQYRSPMQDNIRSHQRIEDKPLPGEQFWIGDILPEPVSVFLPEKAKSANEYAILMHFHGSAFVANTSVSQLETPTVAVNVHLGSGSSVYEQPFQQSGTFQMLVKAVTDSLAARNQRSVPTPQIYLSAFSAGYGAIRAILRTNTDRIKAVLLLDGLHTDYVPLRIVLSEGGKLEETKMEPFVTFAGMAVQGKKRFLLTHSEIFPGTYASTTETADFILSALGLRRIAALEWGPGGMQLLSKTEAGRMTILGFAGNTAPDHVDHFHGMPVFLAMLLGE